MNIEFDGDIFNRKELSARLGLPEASDSEIVLACYKKFGETCAEMFDGEFAFVVRDGPNLFGARDRIGRRGFFYTFVDGVFLWASSQTELSRHPKVSRQPNLETAVSRLLDDFTDQEQTLYKNIYRLPPAHSMRINNGLFQKWAYWSFEPKNELKYRSSQEYAEHFLELFSRAILKNIGDKKHVGVTISGGLDSSSVACLTRRLHPNLESFSLRFNHPSCHDQGSIDQILSTEQLNFPPWVHHDLEGSEERLELIDLEFDRNYEDVSYCPTFFLYRPLLQQARNRNISLLFAGDGADEILTPSGAYLADLLRGGRFFDLYSELKHWDDPLESLPNVFLNNGLKPLLTSKLTQRLLRKLRPRRPPSWLNSDTVKKFGVIERATQHYRNSRRPFRDYRRNSFYFRLFVSGIYSSKFEEHAQIAKNYGINFAYPYHDWDLTEFAFRIPNQMQVWRGISKIILREAMRGILPESVRVKPKFQDYSYVSRQSLLRQKKLFDMWFENSQLESHGILNSSELESLWQAPLAAGNVSTLFSVINMERWLRTF